MATSHALTRWLFLRALAIVFLIAFLSYWVQLDGLIGSRGILPARALIDAASTWGAARFWHLPTLCWLGVSDGCLHALAATGTLLSLVLLAGVATRLVLLLLWAIYLSLVVVGQTFYSFQWDILLLETAFTALFFAPGSWRPRAPWSEGPVPRGGLWLVRGLTFKLMFLSGITKLICLDPTWWGLTALDYHYWTQPLPVWTSWYAAQLPASFQRASVFLMFVIELGAPLSIFCPRRWRIGGAFALLALQALIAATGNYGFFNLLSAVLCLPLLDDRLLVRLLPRRWRHPAEPSAPAAVRGVRHWAYVVAVVLVGYASSLTFVEEMVRTRPPGKIGGLAGALLDAGAVYVAPGRGLLELLGPFRTISGYGLFRSMTTSRPEIVIEASDDGQSWREIEFRWKPGDVTRRPRFVAPHQPRLDWQMWFAALNPRRAGPWLQGLLQRVLEGSPPVLRLVGDPSLRAAPPRFLRLAYYDYRFAAAGAWWQRERRGELTAPLTRESFRPPS
ncbi:MAG TPA: lipase maturation factor family protein [Candidatus Polarisedimenticolaceae bacterium]|nr:lipase maturation factor family protein [Candidatus Polarisedimenticolaceae bacterium]